MLCMSLPLQEFFFTYHFSQEFFWRGTVTPPPVISNGPSLNKHDENTKIYTHALSTFGQDGKELHVDDE